MVDGITASDGRVLDRGTGLSKATVARGLARLREKGIILAGRNRTTNHGDQATTYRLRFMGDEINTPRVSALRHPPVSHQRDTPVSQQRDTQETVRQETALDPSNFEKHTHKLDGHDDGEASAARRAEKPAEVSESPWRVEAQSPSSTAVLDDPGAEFGHPDESPASVPTPGYQRLKDVALAHRATLASPPSTKAGRGEATLAELIQARQQTSNLAPATRKDPPTPETTLDPSQQEVESDTCKVSRRGRPPGSKEAREVLTAYLSDFARECNDQAPLPSTVTRAYRLFEQAGIPTERYPDFLYQCRSIVQERSGQIKKQASTSSSAFVTKNKMPYFLAVLQDQLGLKPGHSPQTAHPDTPTATNRTPRENRDKRSPFADYPDPTTQPQPSRYVP